MTIYDPNDLLKRWETYPRAITMDEAIRQMMEILCQQQAHSKEQERNFTHQLAIQEKALKGITELVQTRNESFQRELEALEKAVVALEKASETRSNEIEESISKDLTEILDSYIQIIQEDIREFQAKLKAQEQEIKALQADLAGIHPTAELFVLELATAFNTLNRLLSRSQQVAFVLGGRKANLFQQEIDPEDFERDSKGKDSDVPPDDFVPQK